MRSFVLLLSLSAALTSTGCGDDDDHHHDSGDASTLDANLTDTSIADAAPSFMNVSLRFRAKVGTQVFACNQNFTGLGTSSTTWQGIDLRFYVHDVKLINGAGTRVPVTLVDDSRWQRQGLALLDFENATGQCTGNADLNDVVVGTVPVGTYTGLEFTLGVPFNMNHQDRSVAPAPLNLSSMFWTWLDGYKFLKIDGKTTGLPTGTLMHLGSTGCVESSPNVVTSCATPNRRVVTLTGFNPASSVVVADLATLFAGSNLDANAGGPPGCMSGPTDTDCAPIFAALGLAFGGGAQPATQSFFRVE